MNITAKGPMMLIHFSAWPDTLKLRIIKYVKQSVWADHTSSMKVCQVRPSVKQSGLGHSVGTDGVTSLMSGVGYVMFEQINVKKVPRSMPQNWTKISERSGTRFDLIPAMLPAL